MRHKDSFDPKTMGLLSHYSPDAQGRIRRLMLEDWKAAGVKLPTYMKLVARYVASVQPREVGRAKDIPHVAAADRARTFKVPEDWLTKLSHQTMDKMFKGISTPRYEFWACLHLYLAKKYGPVEIDPAQISEADMLGQAVARFGQLEDAPPPATIEIDATTRLEIDEATGTGFAPANLMQTHQGPPPLSLEIEEEAHGIAIQQGEDVLAVMRDVITYEISMITIEGQA